MCGTRIAIITLMSLLLTLPTCQMGIQEASGARTESQDIRAFLPASDGDVGVRAFLFPGRTKRRALIVSGIHGDEVAAVEVMERLRIFLRERSEAGERPFFTTILVPVAIPRTQRSEQRYVPEGVGLVEAVEGGRKVWKVVRHQIEPNLNFPLPGENFQMAQQRGKGQPTKAELMTRIISRSGKVQKRPPRGPLTSIRMLPETRFLVQLIERFQPERLAAVHAHSRQSVCHPCVEGRQVNCGGEGPGIFVDPRGMNPVSGKLTNRSQFNKDKLLAQRMLDEGLKRLNRTPLPTSPTGDPPFPPFAGNQSCSRSTVLYFSGNRREGNSLGDWAPVPTPGRPGITTLTVEVPKYQSADAPAATRVIDLHRDLLADVFLAQP
jgi:hypothetical protein